MKCLLLLAVVSPITLLVAQGLDALDVAGSKKRQTRGGKGVVKTKKKVDCKQQTLSHIVSGNYRNNIALSAQRRTQKDNCVALTTKQEKICYCRNRVEDIWYV